ncbi:MULTISPECIES: hypothetical protein [unclassified Shinella]|uniref:hypothetical protein n=1 Tax=unclassified Shinella TaxID=2643062 RepID=UPI00234F988F|nr:MULTISPECIES: hypothetical protein [unclassified Shinella]MCO5139539.1 hypothetical protein [Shinella sp.]MDC7258462.1 hypothetical protein [Shinella sp. YE25]
MVRRFTAAISSLILAMAIPAQSSVPKGWFLHEDQAPTLTLAYYDPSSGDVVFAVTCTGQTSMEQRLVDLLHGGFTLASDGQEMRTFSTTGQDPVHVRNLTEACRG